MPGTIWWDFDGTLVDRPRMWSEVGLRILDQLRPSHRATQEQISEDLRAGFPWHQGQSAEHPELATPGLWWDAIYRVYSNTFQNYGFTDAELKTSMRAIRELILDARLYRIFDDVKPVLDLLTAAGWRHLVVSNHVPELIQIIHDLGIGRYFSAVLSSGSVGYEKPHRLIFEVALEHSIRNRSIWMIGDNVACDCMPVAALGVNAVLVRSKSIDFEPCAQDLWGVVKLILAAEQ